MADREWQWSADEQSCCVFIIVLADTYGGEAGEKLSARVEVRKSVAARLMALPYRGAQT